MITKSMANIDICFIGQTNYPTPPGEHHYKPLGAPRQIRQQLAQALALPTVAFNRHVGLVHGKRRTIGFTVRVPERADLHAQLQQILLAQPQLQILTHRPGALSHQKVTI